MKYVFYLLCLFSVTVYANNNYCISFKKNYSDYENSTMYDLDAYISNCKKESKKIDTLGYFGDSPKINFYFLKKIDLINRVFISTYVYTGLYEENPTYVYENGKYNFTSVYDCNGLSCRKNKRLSDFFGDGANLVELKKNIVVTKFPYESKINIENELDSNFFKMWSNDQLKFGVIIKKTDIYQSIGVNSEKIGYLIEGDKFKIKEVSSRWLNIIYTNKNGRTTSGWIACQDTTVCN